MGVTARFETLLTRHRPGDKGIRCHSKRGGCRLSSRLLMINCVFSATPSSLLLSYQKLMLLPRSGVDLWRSGDAFLRSGWYGSHPFPVFREGPVMSSLRLLLSDSHDPLFNLAVEECIFRQMDPAQRVLFLWRNDNTVVT